MRPETSKDGGDSWVALSPMRKALTMCETGKETGDSLVPMLKKTTRRTISGTGKAERGISEDWCLSKKEKILEKTAMEGGGILAELCPPKMTRSLRRAKRKVRNLPRDRQLGRAVKSLKAGTRAARSLKVATRTKTEKEKEMEKTHGQLTRSAETGEWLPPAPEKRVKTTSETTRVGDATLVPSFPMTKDSTTPAIPKAEEGLWVPSCVTVTMVHTDTPCTITNAPTATGSIAGLASRQFLPSTDRSGMKTKTLS